MCINPESRLVLMEPEATQGTPETPVVGTNDVFVSNQDSAGIKQNATMLQVRPATPQGYGFKGTLGTIKPSASYRFPWYMKGLSAGALVIPAWMGTVLRTCGVVDLSVGSGAEALKWSPDGINPRNIASDGTTITNSLQTLTIYDWIGRDGTEAAGTKLLYRMVGAMVSKITITIQIGSWCYMDVEFLGEYVEPATSTQDLSGYLVDSVTRDFTVPFAAGQRFTYEDASTDAIQPSSTVWTIDFQASQVESDAPGGYGVGCVVRKQAIVTVTTNPIISSGTFNKAQAAQTAMQVLGYDMSGSLTPQGRTVDTGYTVKAVAPQCQGTIELNRSNELRHDFTGEATQATKGGFPFSLLLT
jgi:hypothetical protein